MKYIFVFFQESGVVIDMSMKQPFLELNRILEALRMQDLRPALEYGNHSDTTVIHCCVPYLTAVVLLLCVFLLGGPSQIASVFLNWTAV